MTEIASRGNAASATAATPVVNNQHDSIRQRLSSDLVESDGDTNSKKSAAAVLQQQQQQAAVATSSSSAAANFAMSSEGMMPMMLPFKEMIEMWRPHEYKAPPKSPTRFFIDDILHSGGYSHPHASAVANGLYGVSPHHGDMSAASPNVLAAAQLLHLHHAAALAVAAASAHAAMLPVGLVDETSNGGSCSPGVASTTASVEDETGTEQPLNLSTNRRTVADHHDRAEDSSAHKRGKAKATIALSRI
jgi:hypothetical protein